ncbi:NAD-binding protein, partial [Enterococcus faecalis]
MKVIIFGGSGFLGQQIAKILVQRQQQVISVSRHGKPATLSASW